MYERAGERRRGWKLNYQVCIFTVEGLKGFCPSYMYKSKTILHQLRLLRPGLFWLLLHWPLCSPECADYWQRLSWGLGLPLTCDRNSCERATGERALPQASPCRRNKQNCLDNGIADGGAPTRGRGNSRRSPRIAARAAAEALEGLETPQIRQRKTRVWAQGVTAV